jgi:hypothetical protein
MLRYSGQDSRLIRSVKIWNWCGYHYTTILGDIRMKSFKLDVSKLIAAHNAEESALAALEGKRATFASCARELFADCKTVSDYNARRELVNAAIDAKIKDADKATKIKAKVRTNLNRMLPEGLSLNKRKGGRKATKATKATPAATKTTKAAPATATIQAANTTDFLPMLAARLAGKSKSELMAERQRVDGMYANAIANAK